MKSQPFHSRLLIGSLSKRNWDVCGAKSRLLRRDQDIQTFVLLDTHRHAHVTHLCTHSRWHINSNNLGGQTEAALH